MRVATILANDICQMKKKMDLAYPFADLLELRLDGFENVDKEALLPIVQGAKRPLILTLRRKDQGGFFSQSEEKRLAKLYELISLEVAFLDLEYDIPIEFIRDLKKLSKTTQFIGSYHDLERTPENLVNIYRQFEQKPFEHFKIVTRASSSLDVLRVMHFLKNTSRGNLSSMCMGIKGEVSRIMAKACGSEMVYGYVGEKMLLGQVSLEELESIYHIPSGKDDRPLYGLIGDPLEQSPGHIYHNKTFLCRALYVKIPLTPDEAKEFFLLENRNPIFRGLSVTTPLKEAVIPYVDRLSEDALKAGGVNTLYYDQGKRIGDNTDGRGALDAIQEQMKIEGITIGIAGTGPTARAIAHEAKKRNALVTLFSRNPKRVKGFVKEAEIRDLSSLDSKQSFDCFIDATGTGIGDIPPTYEMENVPSCVAYMHISLPSTKTLLYSEAMKRKAKWISGEQMFTHQAEYQQRIWKE